MASVRLDSLLSLAFSASRTKLSGLIEGAKVFVNGKLITTNSYQLKENDVISVRGYGKFRYNGTGAKTKRTEFMYLFINIFNKDRGRSNTMEERKKTGKSYLWALFAFLLAVAADQFTKWLAVTYLKDQDPLIIIPGVFQFRYLENRGAAFESCRIGRLYLQLEHC